MCCTRVRVYISFPGKEGTTGVEAAGEAASASRHKEGVDEVRSQVQTARREGAGPDDWRAKLPG